MTDMEHFDLHMENEELSKELERLREGYMMLAHHIAPDMDAAEASSRAPEQIIDWGLQLRQRAELENVRMKNERDAYREENAMLHLSAKHSANVACNALDEIKQAVLDERERCAMVIETIAHEGLYESLWERKFKNAAEKIRRGAA